MAKDLSVGIKLNLDTKQGQTNLQGFEAAFTRSLKALGQSPGEIKAIRELIDGARKGTVSITGIDKAFKNLVNEYNTGRSVADARDLLGLRDHAGIVRDINAIRQAYSNLQQSGALTGRELAQANLAMRDQIAALKAETNGWTATLSRARGELTTAAVAVGSLGLVLGSAASKAAGFGKKMAEVSTLLDDTRGMATLTQGVRDLSREYGGEVNTNAKALYDIISAGATDTASALQTLTVANRLAIGGVTDVGTAADGLTSILNAYGLSAKDAASVSDAFFVAVKAGKTTVPELAASLGQVAPIANTAGVSLDQLLASVAALTAGGTRTPEAITGIRSALVNIIQPSAEAQKLAKQLGFAFDAQALKAQGLQGFLNNVARATGGNISQMSQLFGSVEGLNAVLTLTGAGAAKFSQTLDAMANKAGQTDAAVAKMMDSPAFAAEQFKAAVTDLQISLGEAVTALTPLLRGLTDLLNAFNDLPPGTRSTAAALGVLLVAALPLGLALRSIGAALGTLRLGLTILANPLKTTATGLAEVGSAAATAAPSLTKLSLIRSASQLGVAAVVGFTAVELYELTAAMREAAKARAELANAPIIKRQSLQTTIDINAPGANTAVATRAQLERMSAFEYTNYTQRLQQAKDYYAAKRDLLSQNLKPNEAPSAEALAAAGEARQYTEALANLKTYQTDRATAETAFNARLSSIKTAQTEIITNAIADQLRKYQEANKALADLQKQRADIEARFQQSADGLGTPKNAPAPDIVAVQAAVQKAQGLQQDGNLQGAATAAEQARQLIDAANAAGTVSDYFLKDYLSRAKDVALAANQGQQAAVQSQIDGYKASIEALKSAADWMKQLTIGYDTAAAFKSTADLQAQLQALMAQNPLVQKVVVQKVDATDTGANNIVNTGNVNTKGSSSTPATPGYASGGLITGPGTSTSDSILARLSQGEFVQKHAAVRYYGVDFMHALNNLRLPKFATGGLVANLDIPALTGLGASHSPAVGSSGNGSTIYLTIGGQQHGPLTAEDSVAKTLKRAAAMFGAAR